MDIDTFTNHIINLGKQDFDVLCRVVLNDALGLHAYNVDGKNDGGTDFAVHDDEGKRIPVAYQLTTQKTDIKKKAYNDAKKTVEKLGVKRFYFLPTYNLSETEARKIESDIEDDLGISSYVFSPKTLAGLVTEHNLVGKFFELTNVTDGSTQTNATIDYLERALHTYTILSADTRNLKSQMYDDSMLYILSDASMGKKRSDLVDDTAKLLLLSDNKKSVLNGRIDALMQKGMINNAGDGFVVLSSAMAEDISLRKRLYSAEQSTFYSAQVDLLKDYNISWTVEDSKKSSVWIANDIIYQQIAGLKSAGAEISNPLYKNVRRNGLDKLRNLLLVEKNLKTDKLNEILQKMVVMASSHPLVVKIVRASVYISLEGAKPLAAAKSLGINNWSEMRMLVEPTIGIPFVCSLQYRGTVNSYFDNAIIAIKRAKELGIKLMIPYCYIKECAGHLLLARRYDAENMNLSELQYSRNAFVANYCALRLQGVPMPSNFLKYLATFSPAVLQEHSDQKTWQREITTDIQSIFLQAGVEFLDMPKYIEEDLKDIETIYRKHLPLYSTKTNYLIQNDVMALKCTNNRVFKENEHWMILTYDNSLITSSEERFNQVWINNPYYFLDMTELTSELPDSQFCSLIHSFAQYSERTLSIGARIIDRIVYYSSENMQQWQFKQELEKLKHDIILSAANKTMEYVDSKTDEFLQKHGMTLVEEGDDALNELVAE